MERVHEGVPRKEFTMPPSVQQKTICQQTGFLATSTCPAITEYFAEGSVPSVSCSGHYVYRPTDDKKEDDEDDKDGDDTDHDTSTGNGSGSGSGNEGGTGTSGGSTTGGNTPQQPSGGTGTGTTTQ